MDINTIDGSELLYRVIKKSDSSFSMLGKLAPALFIDSRGLSVDRDGGREESEIIESFRKRFGKKDEYMSSVKISAENCIKAETYPNPVNNHRNKYHAEIHDSKEKVEISVYKAMKLASLCEVCEYKKTV